MGSRIKAVSSCFANVGAEIYDFSRDAFDFVVDHAREDVPRIVSGGNIKRATKWVLVTGAPVGLTIALQAVLVSHFGVDDHGAAENFLAAAIRDPLKKAVARFDP